jgi:hypothetical protein
MDTQKHMQMSEGSLTAAKGSIIEYYKSETVKQLEKNVKAAEVTSFLVEHNISFNPSC